MPNGLSGGVRLTVEEFAELVKAIPAEVLVGATFEEGPEPHMVTAGELLKWVFSGNRQRIVIAEHTEYDHSSYYAVMLDGRFDGSVGAERRRVLVHDASPLFAPIRKRHHSTDHS